MSTLALTKVMLAFIASLAIVMLGMPSLIRLAVQKNLLDEPLEDRKVHTRSVPRLGGVLIFIGTLVTTSVLVTPTGEEAIAFLRLGAASTILFFLGLKDDLSVLDPYKKLIVQVAVGGILIFGGGFMVDDFSGLFGLTSVSMVMAIPFSLFVYIVVVNAVNLIDGVDTLAGGYGLLVAISCALWFQLTGQPNFAILCLALAGSSQGSFCSTSLPLAFSWETVVHCSSACSSMSWPRASWRHQLNRFRPCGPIGRCRSWR